MKNLSDIKTLKPIFKYGQMDMIDWFEITQETVFTIIRSGLKHPEESILSPFNLMISVVGKDSEKRALEIFSKWWRKLKSIKEGEYNRLEYSDSQKKYEFYEILTAEKLIERENSISYGYAHEKTIVGNTTLPAVYPLIDNHRWYSENGTVYNEADESVRIVLLHENGSYSSLPNEIANMIVSALNSR